MSARTWRTTEVLDLYQRTAGGDPDGVIPWGLGPATDADLGEAVVRANAAGDLKRPVEPWTSAEAGVIRDYLVGLVSARRPHYRVAFVAEIGEGGAIDDRGRLALVYDEDGIADNWQTLSASFRRATKGTRPIPVHAEGLGPTTASLEAARLGISKRELQRRRAKLKG